MSLQFCQVIECKFYTTVAVKTDCPKHGRSLGAKDTLQAPKPERRFVDLCEHGSPRVQVERPCVGGIASVCIGCGQEV